MISHSMPKVIIDLAPSVEIHYIGSVKAGETIKLTSNETIVATNRFSDPEVAPGKLDIILVPGPDPTTKFPEDSIAWLRAQGDTPGVDILSVCTGIFICGQAGLLRGKNVCGPRALQDMIRAKGFGEKALLGDKYRWIQDGNFWSSGESLPILPLLSLFTSSCRPPTVIPCVLFFPSLYHFPSYSVSFANTHEQILGGVTNGNDLVAAYARASPHFPNPVVEIACEMTDVGDRPRAYEKGQLTFTLGMALSVFRAWLMGWRKQS